MTFDSELLILFVAFNLYDSLNESISIDYFNILFNHPNA
jgi:hypothetical protein